MGLASDGRKVVLFNESFQLIQEIKFNSTLSIAGWDTAGDYFYCVDEGSQRLHVYETTSFNEVSTHTSSDIITAVRFSNRRGQIILLQQSMKSTRISKFIIDENDRTLKLFREYSNLHAPGVAANEICISSNAQYILTASTDSLFKVRGVLKWRCDAPLMLSLNRYGTTTCVEE